MKRLLPKGTKIGHTGTLDPLASGLLVLLLGRATRLSRYVTGLNKTYLATARFGATSSTLDADGDITELPDPTMPPASEIRAALRQFSGEILQTPPMTSAIKIGGERLYRLHRRGEIVEREARGISVNSFELTAMDSTSRTAGFDISCSSGTYIRSLLADLAESLDTGAYVTALRRTSVGHLRLDDAASLGELTIKNIYTRIIHMREVIAHLPVMAVGDSELNMVRNGRPIDRSGTGGSFRVEYGQELLAVYQDAGLVSRPEVVLCGE